MATIPTVPTNIGPPVYLQSPIVQGASGLDLTTVNGCQFLVERADGTTTTWTGSIATGATSVACTAQYPFQAGDVAVLGLWTIQTVLLVPGGSVPCEPPMKIRVVTPYQQ